MPRIRTESVRLSVGYIALLKQRARRARLSLSQYTARVARAVSRRQKGTAK